MTKRNYMALYLQKNYKTMRVEDIPWKLRQRALNKHATDKQKLVMAKVIGNRIYTNKIWSKQTGETKCTMCEMDEDETNKHLWSITNNSLGSYYFILRRIWR